MAAIKAGFAYAYALLCMIVALSAPALANEAELRKQVDRVATAYIESYKKQDAAGLVALYAKGGVLVTPLGVQTDLAALYGGAFKAGFNQLEVKVDQVWPLGSDAALAAGPYKASGKSPAGAPLEASGLWTATYVREGSGLKIGMLTSFPPAPPPKN